MNICKYRHVSRKYCKFRQIHSNKALANDYQEKKVKMQRKLFKNDEGLRAAISKKKLAILIFTHNAIHWTWWRQPFWKAVSAILNSKMYKQIFKKNHSKWLKNVRIWVQFYAHFIYTKLFLMIIKKMCWNAHKTPQKWWSMRRRHIGFWIYLL